MKRTTIITSLTIIALSTLIACSGGSTVTTSSIGPEVYQGSCATCHSGGLKGWLTGAPKVGDKEAWKPLIAKGVDAMTIFSIKGVNKMPAKGGCTQCSDEQIKFAIEHMLELSK